MTTLSSLTASPDLLRPLAGLTPPKHMIGSDEAKRAQIKKTADDFEASFLSTALGSMFEGVTVSAPFGGGEGEDAFKSFLNDAMAKQIVARGGIGVAAAVQREMLRMQGLTPEPVK